MECTWNSFVLPQTICKALLEEGFTEPTQIQSLTLPAAILGRRDIIGAAETGSGKTLAFGLPILTGILNIKNINEPHTESVDESDSEDSCTEQEINDIEVDDKGCIKFVSKAKSKTPQKPLYALILTPTRELAIQIKNHLIAAAKYTGINVAVVVGGMAAVKQERILSKGPEIVVATPGRLWQLIQLGNPHLAQIEDIKFLAIDETDRMLEKKHFEELSLLLERINSNETKKQERQNFVFSATLTLVHELPKYLLNKLNKSKKIKDMKPEQKLQKIIETLGITNPKIVDITQGVGTSGTLTECKITCSLEEKDYYVYYFLQKHQGRTLIFCNSIGCVKRLSNLLGLLNCNPLPLHASMPQRQRLKNLERFRDNELGVLVATDVAARGLDIPCVEHVLHYQTPRTSEGYIHRSGRTARIFRQGITVLMIDSSEVRSYIKLCRTLGKDKDLPTFPVQQNFLRSVKDRVNLAKELDKLELRVKKGNSEVGWFKKAADEMDIVLDDIYQKYDTKETTSCKKLANIKRKQLLSLLGKPIFPETFNGKFPLSSVGFSSPVEQPEKAVDVANSVKPATKCRPLYKPNKHKLLKNNKTKK